MSPSHQLSNLDSWPTAKVDIARLILDGSTQARAAIDPAARARYMERYRDGLDMDPLVLFGDLASGPLWVGDGHTRASGALDAGMRTVEAQVRPGGQREALLYAISDANGRHGSPLTLTDRRKAAQILIDDPEWSQMADREIARRSGLSPSTIAALRPAPAEGETRKGADGKTRKLPQRSEPVDLNSCNRPDLWQRFLEGKLTGPESRAKRTTWPPEQEEEDNRILAEYKAKVRAARVAGRADPSFPPMPAGWLTAGAPVPKAPAADRWVRFLEERLTKAEEAERRTWPEEARKADTRAQFEWLSARKAAKEAGQPKPPYPPMPSHWLTPGGASDPAAAAAKALSAAEALGRDDASRKSPRMIGEVVQRLRQASHLIPSGQDQAIYKAYTDARKLAMHAIISGAAAPAADQRQAALPLAEQPKPAPYVPLFQDGPLAAGADAEDEDEDEFDDEDQGAPPAEDRDDEDDRRHVRDVLREELQGDAADLRRDLEAVRAELAQALRERDEARAELGELRTTLAGAKFVEQVRDALADEVRRLREEAGACGLVTCEADEDDGDPCGRLAPPCPDGPALCQRHRQQAAVKVAPPGSWQPASIGGAKAVHALPYGAIASEDEGHPAALCRQRPDYKSKGWTPRPGTRLTCKGCIAATTSEETK